ncbi:hypothetical protein D6C86_09943 [Aureobasidium pullulans]|uniref:Uncharacterized protein n=1 Tax=Aureobasidium pullulans TaxID=5580 RepID=A0A4S9PE85_AURPU|nr:hypothetical protein D6C94_10530 [Aureobasidium pullulans]THZ51150.1 hypothetical protein D6C88_09792 [Aureobasidium pullulans]THZ53214.1 hypothetical protein D6C86_09943 [Aureobasidium pullulans]
MIRIPARHRLHATLALAALPEAQARSAPLPIVLPGNDNASDDKQVFSPSKRPKPPKTPKAIAKGSNKLQAKPPKSDDGEEEEEEEEVEEVEDGSVKVKEESLQLLKTTLERLRNSELLQCDSQLVHRHDGTNSEIAVSDGASSIEFDDRLMPANDDDDQHQDRTPDRCLCQEPVEACSLQMSSPEDWSAIEAR